jgi:hypothetical protein
LESEKMKIQMERDQMKEQGEKLFEDFKVL